VTEPPRPLSVILCPPWPRSGSSSLFRAQAGAYRAMGFDVVVVALPQDASHTVDKQDFWRRVAADFRFEPDQPVFLNRSIHRARRFVRAGYGSWLAHGCDSVIAVESRIASGSAFDPAFLALVDRRGVAVIHVNHCVNIGAARRIARLARAAAATAPIVLLDTQDVQVERYQACEIVNPFTGRPDDASRLAGDELALSRRATALLHLTTHELAHFRRLLPGRPHFLLRPTTRNEPSSAAALRGEPTIDFLFVGNGHRANVRSIEWFLTEVVPRLDRGRIRVRIAGGIADHFRVEDPGLHAAYPDVWIGERETIDDLYAAARFVVAPMTGGSGISIKLVEALAMGKFVVTTSRAVAAFDGIAGLGDAVAIADSPEAFAAAMTAMAARADTDNAAGRALYLRHLSNTCYTETLSGIVAGLRPGAAARSSGGQGS
jgi:polysaccharide biosynthesis protein PslH